MQVLIIEDEKPAARHLTALLQKHDPTIEVLAQLDTVKKAVAWFNDHPAPDLVFLDIQLADGLSFSIFEQVTVTSPIIFTTAYDQYAVQAFRVNSVDYLLKPIGPDELAQALDKFWQHYGTASAQPAGQPPLWDSAMMRQIQRAISTMSQPYKHRFVVKVGEHIRPIPVAEVLYFTSQDKVTFMQTRTDQKASGRRFIIDYSLDQVEAAVDPGRFFRISRQYIVSLEAVEDIITYSSSRLKLILRHCEDNQVLVSRERVATFRQWLDQ